MQHCNHQGSWGAELQRSPCIGQATAQRLRQLNPALAGGGGGRGGERLSQKHLGSLSKQLLLTMLLVLLRDGVLLLTALYEHTAKCKFYKQLKNNSYNGKCLAALSTAAPVPPAVHTHSLPCWGHCTVTGIRNRISQERSRVQVYSIQKR